MKTLAVLLISLALAHGNMEIYESQALNLIGTDAINDVIKYYNYFYQSGPPPAINDVIADHAVGTDHYHVRALEGSVAGGNVELASELAQLQFQLFHSWPLYGEPGEWYNRIVANFSVMINDMELNYGNLIVNIKEGAERADPSYATDKKSTANVMIEKNEFSLQVEQRHYRIPTLGCLTTVNSVTTEEFAIGNVTISGFDPAMDAIVEVLANRFKDQFLTEQYAASIIESVIQARAPHFFRNCQYVTHFPF